MWTPLNASTEWAVRPRQGLEAGEKEREGKGRPPF